MNIKISTNIKNSVVNVFSTLKNILEKINQHNSSPQAHNNIIPTKTSLLTNDSQFVSDADYVHTDNNFTDELWSKLNSQSGINTGDETTLSIVSKLGFSPVSNKITINGHALSSNITVSATDTGAPTISSGSAAPVSTPTKIGDVYVDTTNKKMYISKGTSSSADWIKQNGSYTLTGNTVSWNPADATTYYLGVPYATTPHTAGAARKIYVPRSGVITTVNTAFYNSALGSNETSSFYIVVNNTTSYLVSSSIVNNTYNPCYSTTNLSVAVNAGDYIEYKWVAPTWATNPTGVFITATALIDL